MLVLLKDVDEYEQKRRSKKPCTLKLLKSSNSIALWKTERDPEKGIKAQLQNLKY